MTTIGVVVIGRNEGPRLGACLRSVRASAGNGIGRGGGLFEIVDLVYVDSNSTDDSVALAGGLGAEVVVLDPDVPFTAARARNAGARHILSRHPEVDLLQFLDGDTELNPGWLAHAAAYLRHHPGVAVVCGRRRERHPGASLYNLLADMEWDTPIGNAQEFGGDALLRAPVFLHLGGYDESFIAGEEPEFAARLRKATHGIVRLKHEMTLHDLAMMRFGQWWRRTLRSGHALAQLAHRHGGAPLFFYRRQLRSTLLWGALVPAGILVLCWLVSAWLALLLPAAYAWLVFRVCRYRLNRGDDESSALSYALFTALGKFPQLCGAARFYLNLWRGRSTGLIEYKAAPAHPPAQAVGNT